MILAVDFDGTIVTNDYPIIKKEMPDAFSVLKKLKSDGHFLILWTNRSGKQLKEAVEYCALKGLVFDAVNDNAPFISFNPYPKIYADIYIDDRNLGGLPSWAELYHYIKEAQ